ncbi:hypothetical protein CU044_6305 [Streptomyces sp. L-9-10]|nr:hypothetical protein CU044_6305 [Streptomyces sp. L-9-10]
MHLLAGYFGRQDPWWALDDDLAHSSPIPLPDGMFPIGAPVATGSIRGEGSYLRGGRRHGGRVARRVCAPVN